jgi:lysophospholipase L1-like esterase
VKSVSESTADGGSNVVEFTDGKTLTVKNGKQGSAGKTPVRGVDYYTEADKEEFLGSVNAVRYVAQNLTEAQKAQARANIGATAGDDVEFAESVEWLNENGDTSKKYVLPDGYIYTYSQKTQTVKHDAMQGTIHLNMRVSANTSIDAELRQHYGMFVTDVMEVDNAWASCKLNVSGLEKLYPTWYTAFYVWYYDTDGGWLGYLSPVNFGFASGEVEISLPISIDIAKTYWSNAGYIRLGFGIKDKNTQITESDIQGLVVNIDRLDRIETAYGWYSTGRQHSNDKATQQNSADIATLKEDVATLQEAVQKSSKTSGAVWYALGDSITKGYGVTADTCWVAHVMKYNGYNTTYSKNLGISGLGFAKSDPNYAKTARTVVDENDFSTVDLVTIAIGINDWKEVFSIDTVKSEIGYCFKKILTDNPYCKIFFITPLNMNRGSKASNYALGYNGSDVTGGTLEDFVSAQISVCKEYGIEVIDLTHSSVVNRENLETVLYDGIHPTAAGHLALGRELAKKIAFA